MDVYMPGKNGIDATREMLALDKNARVLTSRLGLRQRYPGGDEGRRERYPEEAF